MQRRSLRPVAKLVAIGVGAVAGYIGIIALLFFWPSPQVDIPAYEELPDSIILDRTSELPEVKAFLARYSDPMIYVERAEGFSASYQIRQCELTGGPCVDNDSVVEPYIALHVILDTGGFPESSYIYCVNDSGGHIIKDNLVGYLQNKSCF